MRLEAALLSILLATACASCTERDRPPPPPGPTVARVEVSPATLSLSVDETRSLMAGVFDQNGSPILSKTVSWSSSDPTKASVTPAGMVRGIAEGTATITASVDGKSGAAAVTVTPKNTNPVETVEVEPASFALLTGESRQLTATAKDTSGAVITGRAVTWTSANEAVAVVSTTGLVSATGPGNAAITAEIEGKSASAAVQVSEPQVEPGDIELDLATRYQTMTGWEATAQMGQWECDRTAFANYRDALVDRAVRELGINRLRLELYSGSENTTDWFQMFIDGQISFQEWRAHWYEPTNDDGNSSSENPSGFKWSHLDHTIDNVVLPFRNALAQRGEPLYVSLCFVDFDVTSFSHKDSPSEYAELILAAFRHIESKYGWVPDGFEVLLEPDVAGWSGAEVGRAFLAAADRLESAGFQPSYTLPSNTSMWGAINTYDEIRNMPGAAARITELAYHRYQAVGRDAAMALGDRVRSQGIKTAMLEHIGSGIDDLMEDLTVAQNSAWQQFVVGFCGGGANTGTRYYAVETDDPRNPRIQLEEISRWFPQIFRHVRLGAVRYGLTVRDGGLDPLAFQNTDGKWVVAVRTQGGRSLTIGRLPPGTYGVYYTTGSELAVERADVTLAAGKALEVSVPAAGMVTVYQR